MGRLQLVAPWNKTSLTVENNDQQVYERVRQRGGVVDLLRCTARFIPNLQPRTYSDRISVIERAGTVRTSSGITKCSSRTSREKLQALRGYQLVISKNRTLHRYSCCDSRSLDRSSCILPPMSPRLSMHLRRAATTQRTLFEMRASIGLTRSGTTAAE
jgi:hypothetical protein